jgi:hypothetical protein
MTTINFYFIYYSKLTQLKNYKKHVMQALEIINFIFIFFA